MIYLISHEDKFLKIGFTNNINKRFSQIQTSSPVKLDLLYLIDGDYNDEQSLHKKFKQFNTSGEWFYYNGSIVDYFKTKKCLKWNYGFIDIQDTNVIGVIKSERLLNNMSLEDLGKMYGCTKQSIKDLELREIQGRITLGKMHKIANLFNKKFEYRFS